MLYLLLAVALCLAVPWLPYLVYRRLPRRPLPPPGSWDLDRLASEVRPRAAWETGEAVPAEAGLSATEVTPSPALTLSGGSESGGPSPASPEPRPASGHKARDLPRLTMPSYWWANVVLVTALMASAFGLGVGWAALFHLLGEEHARTFQPGVFLFKPFHYGLVCFLPGVLLGICSGIVPSLGLMRLLLGRRRFQEYLFWEEGRQSPQGGYMDRILKAWICMGVGVGMLSALLVWQAMNWYARFSEEEIAIKRLLGAGEEVHPYETVQQIVLTSHVVSSDQLHPGERLHLRFRDGRTWSTDTTFHLPPPTELERLLEFLSRKTGRPVTRAQFIKDVPGW